MRISPLRCRSLRPTSCPYEYELAKMRHTRTYGILILVALLTVIYVLSSSGRFHIIDEVSMYAVTESLALRGEVDTNAIAWTQWVNSPGEVLGAFGPDGQVFSKKGPAPSFLAVPWYLLLHLFSFLNIRIGQLQGTLLFNAIVTAWTAAMVWLTALRLRYRDRTGLALGLLFGLATIAWPYAKQFFGEPLRALALLTCFYGLLTWRQDGRARWLVIAGVGAGAALATVNAHAVLIAVLLLWFMVDWVRSGRAWRGRFGLSGLGAFVIPIAVTGVLLVAYNLIRFGSPFDTGYHFESGEGFTTPIWQGLWGLLFSPYRSLFLHTPLFIASVCAFVPFYRRHRSEALAIGALSAVLVLMYSAWWMWWGGFAWGPRFLVPLTPFWVLLLAPVVEGLETGAWRLPRAALPHGRGSDRAGRAVAAARAAVDRAALPHGRGSDRAGNVSDPSRAPSRAGDAEIAAPSPAHPLTRSPAHLYAAFALFWLTAVLAAVSLVVQVGAVTMNFVNYEIALRAIYPTDWSNPLAFGPPAQGLGALLDSPVFGQFRLMAESLTANTDLAWLWADGTVLWLVVITGAAAVVTLGSLLIIWSVLLEDGAENGAGGGAVGGIGGWRMSAPTVLLTALLPVVVIGAWLGEVSRDPLYGTAGEGYRAIVADMCAEANSSDAFVNVVPTGYQIPMNWMPGDCLFALPTFGYATDSGQHPETQTVLQRLMQQHDRFFFVTYGVQPNDPDNTVERWLGANAFKAEDAWYADYRLLQYATPLRLSGVEEQPINQALLGKQAEQVTIVSARAPSVAPAGEPIPIEINFRLEAPTTQNLRWFVQLLSAENIPLAQLDTGPDDNYTTFASLPAREPLVERAGLLVPDNTPEGEYRLIAGLYNPDAGGARLVTIGGPDWVEIGSVRVVRGE